MKVISNLRISEQGLEAKGKNGKWCPVLLSQGDMDGACSVYSLMMDLILIRTINRSDVTIRKKADGRMSKGRLLHEFLDNHGLVVNGFEFEELKSLLQSSFLKVVTSEYIDEDNILDRIKGSIDDDIPIIIGIYFNNKDGHALVAIGYDTNSDGGLSEIYCLDPGLPKTNIGYWNAVIKVNEYRNTQYKHLYLPINDRVSLSDALLITKR